VQDPGNAGTLIRTAVAFGLDAVLLGKGSVELANPKLVRATAGSLFQLPLVAERLDLVAVLRALLASGWHVLRAEVTSDSPPALPAEGQPWVLLLGSEAHGLTDGLRTQGTPISIPMAGPAESLNVAVAGAILLYRLVVEHNL
jgi:TrmH family RNA methyltransferase